VKTIPEAENPTKANTPGTPVTKRTPTASRSPARETESDDDDHVGDHQPEQQVMRRMGVNTQPVEVPILDVGHEVGALDIPVTAKAMAIGMRKAL